MELSTRLKPLWEATFGVCIVSIGNDKICYVNRCCQPWGMWRGTWDWLIVDRLIGYWLLIGEFDIWVYILLCTGKKVHVGGENLDLDMPLTTQKSLFFTPPTSNPVPTMVSDLPKHLNPWKNRKGGFCMFSYIKTH